VITCIRQDKILLVYTDSIAMLLVFRVDNDLPHKVGTPWVGQLLQGWSDNPMGGLTHSNPKREKGYGVHGLELGVQCTWFREYGVHGLELGVQCAWFREYGVHSLELGVQCTWFRETGVPGFESMGYLISRVWVYAFGSNGIQGMGYIVSHYP